MKRYDAALTQYKWIFRDLDKLDRFLSDVQMNYFLGAWCDLGNAHPVAHDELMKLRDRCRRKVLSAEHFLPAFRIILAIHSRLGMEGETVALFTQLDRERPERARQVFPFAEASLVTGDEFALIAKYAEDQREFPKIIGADASILSGGQTRQFETLVALIALYMREGRAREAIEIASDAKILWPDDQASRTIDRALQGILP